MPGMRIHRGYPPVDELLDEEEEYGPSNRMGSKGLEIDHEGIGTRAYRGGSWIDQTGTRRVAGPYVGRGPKGYVRSDQRIYEDVCERLMRFGHVDATDIEVQVNRGEVTLEGWVNDRPQKRLAEDLADGVPGVLDVHNMLRIRRQAGVGTEELVREGREHDEEASARH